MSTEPTGLIKTLTNKQTNKIAKVLKELDDIKFQTGTSVDLKALAIERGVNLGNLKDEQGNQLAWGISYDT